MSKALTIFIDGVLFDQLQMGICLNSSPGDFEDEVRANDFCRIVSAIVDAAGGCPRGRDLQ